MKNQKLYTVFIKFFFIITTINLILLPSNHKLSLAENKKDLPYCNEKFCCPPSKSCYPKPRGENIVVITPINGEFLLNSRPIFSFIGNEKNQLYKITLKLLGEDRPLWETETNNTTITYPQNRNHLKKNLYTLTIENNSAKTDVNFYIIDQKEIKEIEKEINALKEKHSNSKQDTEKIIEVAQFYRQNQLTTEARKTLEEAIANNIKIPQIYFELAEINREIGTWEEVIKYLKQVHQNRNQPFWAAQAEQFIAEVYYCGNNDKINSIDWYKKAKETYQQLGKTEYVEGMKHNINQLKDSDNSDLCDNY